MTKHCEGMALRERIDWMLGTSWKLGKVAGIDVFLHPTFLLLLGYVGLTQGGIGAVLVVSSVFGCVLLHELGHALMARRLGIETEDITLYPIGGVARLQRMPRAPGAEVLIALAGPAVNVLIALGLTAAFDLGLVGATYGAEDGLLGMLAAQLITINWVLALFNLIPAFPMDGGRVLRAFLSGWLGRGKATMLSAGIGRALAMLFAIYCLLNEPLEMGILHACLAGFLYVAAGAELRRVLLEERQWGGQKRWAWARQSGPRADEGVWTAPDGFRWVSVGNGVWQLCPNVVTTSDRVPPPWR
jgi:Zn-dependent protease